MMDTLAKASAKQKGIYILDSGPGLGREQDAGKVKRRPVLVVTNDEFNLANKLIRIMPITTVYRKNPMYIPLGEDLNTNGFIMLD